jgi:pimeloyl-ACP methyl ester carboxylesterase
MERLRAWRLHATGRFAGALAVALAACGCAPPGPRTAAAALEPLRSTAPYPGGTLGLVSAGRPTGPRVILVHGTPGNADGFADYLAHPFPATEVIALDRPGFGRSTPNGAVESLADQAAAVLALLPDDGRPVVLVGHSLGGPVVAWAAAERPESIAAIVLLAASVDPSLEEIHPLQIVGRWAPVRALLPRAIRNANAELLALKMELRALAPRLARIRARVVIVHGTRDTLVPVANVTYLQSHLTGARCVDIQVIEGQNHFLPWNAEDAVRGAVARALATRCPSS